MQGYVLAYRPGRGEGTIVNASGEVYPFTCEPGQGQFGGGDWVSFRVRDIPAPGPSMACDLRVVARWPATPCGHDPHLAGAIRRLLRLDVN
jgi:hypothetical protein